MRNQPIENHPLIGSEVVYRPFHEPYDADQDTTPGALVAGNGMTVTILLVFHNWNSVEGLTVFYVYVHATGICTHFSESELGLFTFPRVAA